VPVDTAAALIAELDAPLHIAAVNARRRVVISGERAAIDRMVEHLERTGIRFRPLRTRHAFHSPVFAAAAAQLAERTRGVAVGPGAIPVVGNLDGAVVAPGALGGDYWGKHIAMPVQFARGVETLIELGAQIVLEIGPERVLSSLVAADHGGRVRSLASVMRDGDAEASLLGAVAALYELGLDLDFAPLCRTAHPGAVSLPARRLANKRYWTTSEANAADAEASAADAEASAVAIADAARVANGRGAHTLRDTNDRDATIAGSASAHDGELADEVDAAVHAVIDRQIDVMRQQLALLGDL
jgi:acyl transferase domain-containing protein